MTESAAKLLALLQERRLLPDLLIESLRKQVAAAPQPLEAHHIAKLLQQKGKITAFQARQLLAEVEGRAETADSVPPEPAAPNVAPTSKRSPLGDNDLGLAEIEEDIPKSQRRVVKGAAIDTRAPKKIAEPATSMPAVAPSLSGGIDELFDTPEFTQPSTLTPDPLGIATPRSKRSWFGAVGGKRKPRAVGWESPLIIIGGGTLLLLIIVGSTLAYLLLRGSGAELFKAAEIDYSNGAYSQAIGKYEKFLRGRASHPQASLARVRIGMAKFRAAIAGEDSAAALVQASAILPTIEHEPALADVRVELATLLPALAENFAEAAAKSNDMSQAEQQVSQYREAMKLVDNPAFLPTSVKAPLAPQLERMQAKIESAVRGIEKDRRLQQAIANMQKATEAGDAAQAYQIHGDLLREYPRLASDAKLHAAVVAISSILRGQVRASAGEFTPEKADHPQPTVAAVALAKPSGERMEEFTDRYVPVVIDGVLYVLAGDDGRLLWRRFVGRGVETARFTSAAAPADVLVADAQRHELVRLRAADGKLQWRLPIGEVFLTGAQTGSVVYVTLLSGRLLVINVDDGQVVRQVSFPQPLASAAQVIAGGDVVVQCGNHSNLYALDAESLACLDVAYVGHGAGTLAGSPLGVGELVVVPQQVGLRRSQLQVLPWNASQKKLGPVNSLAFAEQFASPPQVEGSKLVVLDSSGAVRVLEAEESGESTRLKLSAETIRSQSESPWTAASANLLAIADRELTVYRIPATPGVLAAQWSAHEGDEFVAPLFIDQGVLFHARRRQGKAGVMIVATPLAPLDAQQVGKPRWQTELSLEAPQSSMLIGEATIDVLCATGDRFKFEMAIRGSATLNSLAAVQQPRATAAVRWRSGMLVPNQRGQIEFTADQDQEPSEKIFPFQPPLVADAPRAWLSPAVVDRDRFVAVDRTGDVFLVRMSNQGAPHLAAVAEASIEAALVADPLVFGNRVWVVERRRDSDRLTPITLENLQFEETLALPGRLHSGPFDMADLALVAVYPGKLVAVRPSMEQAWICDLDGDFPAAPPLVEGDSLWLATTAGRVHLIDLMSGEIRRTLDLGEPLGDGPVLRDERIYVRAVDGTVLVAEVPR
jgi:outer membrane protein assembly factor BamB